MAMAYSNSTFVLSDANLDDIPALAKIFPRAYHRSPFFRKMIPDTAANDKWWQEAHRIALLDPKTRFVKVTDREKGEVVAMARWVLPRDDGDQQPGSEEGRWPKMTDDVDHELSTIMFGSMARYRRTLMGDQRHYFLEFIQTAPEYQGRGVASLMMRYGCDMADNDGLEIYVASTMEGYPVYLKYGFLLKVEEPMPGGLGYIQRYLVRPAKTTVKEPSVA